MQFSEATSRLHFVEGRLGTLNFCVKKITIKAVLREKRSSCSEPVKSRGCPAKDEIRGNFRFFIEIFYKNPNIS